MKKRKILKRGLASLLAAVLAVGLLPMMPNNTATVRAAPGSGTEPSVSAYATKDQMMDDTFAPDNTGTASNYGKLVFGKNSSGGAQEWYILGKDEGVSEDNTIIFAASPIATGKKFNSSHDNKTFDSSFGVYASNPSDVYPNHYGASDLRVALQGMATNKNYFTTAEQRLMNATTVKTKDTKNSNETYTTKDNLYALQGKDRDNKLCAGTSNSTVLAMSSYKSNGSSFWLRSPDDDFNNNALFANPSNSVDYHYVSEDFDVQPASNLKLSSVLFASAATAASPATVKLGRITSSEAMTLRFDGTGKDIGTVTYNATTGDIKVVRGDTSQPVSLVVQGKDGTDDWYYSKQIAGPETVNASDIKSVFSLTSDIDLSACKIWLEITDTDGLAYAVGAPDTMPIYVNTPDGNFLQLEIAKTAIISAVKEEVFNKKSISVDEQQLLFNGEVLEDGKTLQDYSIGKNSTLQLKYVVKNVNATINPPKGGLGLDTNVTCAMNGIKSATLKWTDTGNNPVSGNANYYPWCYKAHVTLMPNDGYAVTDATEVHINNNATEEKTINTDGSITVTCCFYSNQDKLTGITAPSPITTGNGAEKTVAGLGLPSQVDITTVEGAASKANVVWDLENLASGTYNPSFLTEQIFTVNGTVTLPEEVGNTDNINLNITIQVTVSAAGIVGAPTANPTAGAYTENQSVALASSTVGATIYYTTDGSEPTILSGVPSGTTKEYTAPIAVTGTEGQSSTTTIKAMAVKNGMQDSSVETFTYTIQLPVSKYTITATAGANGSISPSGAVRVAAGGSQTFTISPSSGYVIDTLKVDGLEVTATTSYTFSEVNSNHTIEVTFKQESRTPNPVDYDILDGANSSWTQNSDGSLSIRGSGAFSKFVGLKVDGTLVDARNYTVKEGSTIVTLKADYLNTLSVGTHTFEILWTDGSASTTFTTKADTSDDGNKKVYSPKTGEDTPVAWIFILFILSGTGLIITSKRGRANPDSSKK